MGLCDEKGAEFTLQHAENTPLRKEHTQTIGVDSATKINLFEVDCTLLENTCDETLD